jgi:hypothetical protein
VTTILEILLLLLPYTVSFGDAGSSFTLVNSTPHYLHAVINGKPYLYIAPHGWAVYDLGPYAGVTVDVTYSPGQNMKGWISKSFNVEINTIADRSSTCSNSNGQRTCSSTTEASTSVSPITWTVQPSDFQSNELQGGPP